MGSTPLPGRIPLHVRAAALDIHQIRRSLDALSGREEIDASRIGMMGLSWGGFYTLVTAAIEFLMSWLNR